MPHTGNLKSRLSRSINQKHRPESNSSFDEDYDRLAEILSKSPKYFKKRGFSITERRITELSTVLTGQVPNGFDSFEIAKKYILEIGGGKII